MKKVKFILPLLAIVFAVAGVFATGNSNPAGGAVDVTLGYLKTPTANCVFDGTCTNTGTPTTCVTSSGLILNIRVNAESCSENASGTWTSDH